MTGANASGWFWGASFADFDNDGWQDIYAADGWVYNDPGTEIELEFLNNVVSRQQDVQDWASSSTPRISGATPGTAGSGTVICETTATGRSAKSVMRPEPICC